MSSVDHPKHYGGAENPFEAIKVIEAWNLGFCLGNTLKYISQCGQKVQGAHIADINKFADAVHNASIEDLKKARWYLDREIKAMERVAERKT